MADTGWRRNKYGGWFNINNYMNDKIRGIADYNDDEDRFLVDNQNLIYDPNTATEEQRQAIMEYTREMGYGDSNMVNGYLNGEKQLSDSAKLIVEKRIKALDSCITQQVNKDFYAYRGVPIRGEDLQVGKIIENKGYTSASINKYDASTFSTAKGTTIKLRVKAGTKALYIGEHTSNFRNEHELLIQRGKSIRIIKSEKLFDKSGDFINYEIEGELI